MRKVTEELLTELDVIPSGSKFQNDVRATFKRIMGEELTDKHYELIAAVYGKGRECEVPQEEIFDTVAYINTQRRQHVPSFCNND